MGVVVSGVCEAAIHSTRRFALCMPENHVLVRLDFKNVFNCIHIDIMLDCVAEVMPELCPFCHKFGFGIWLFHVSEILRFHSI